MRIDFPFLTMLMLMLSTGPYLFEWGLFAKGSYIRPRCFVKSIAKKFSQLTYKSYEGEGTLTYSSSTRTQYKVKGIELMMVAAEHGNPEIVKYLIEKEIGGRTVATAKQTALFDKKICPMFSTARVQAFAKNSGNQEVIDIVKAARLKNY